MSKLFRPKTMRRMVVFLAMVAPAVYLFGVSFSALTGSHGEQVFAEPVYTQEYVGVSSYVDDGVSYRFDVNGDLKTLDYPSNVLILDFDFTFNGTAFTRFMLGKYDDYYFCGTPGNDFYRYNSLTGDETYFVNYPWVFESDEFSLVFVSYFSSVSDIYRLEDVPSAVVVENNSSYTDFWFKNFFAKGNFLVQWGENAISENPYGFAPFGYFWRYLDTNVLHLSNDQAGLMAYGYMYYAAHVLLFDVGFILVTFFLTFIQKVADKIGGEDHA